MIVNEQVIRERKIKEQIIKEKKIKNIYAIFLLVILFSFLGIGMYEIYKKADRNTYNQTIGNNNDKK